MFETQTSRTLIDAQRRAHEERAAVFAQLFSGLGRMLTPRFSSHRTAHHAA
ncbi:hypothetical protein C8N43_2022 [Litoreibacter ponti]|uniref:Uncharacterized protein n=1 Tax=Litoreibacter ponti TaxID=1510457 RepID=A0A2T6BMR2_9RHOB|nr:hypothetical protein [Litoreibacter ponti]PTX57355.1 hypothetical protein C8N43_2022 [Litoreibacter ponti]